MEVFLEKDRVNCGSQILIFDSKKTLKSKLTAEEYKIVINQIEKDTFVDVSFPGEQKLIGFLDLKNQEYNRRLGAEIENEIKNKTVIFDFSSNPDGIYSFLEGTMLNGYLFDKYKSKVRSSSKKGALISSNITEENLVELNTIVEGVFKARNWVNEPVNKLNTSQFIKEIKSFKKIGVSVDVFRKSKLEALSMGGILGVNKGSCDDAALVKVEWKPKKPRNRKPIVLVGKGVLFDTGGINIKTGGSMEEMKADMGGASIVLAVLKVIAKQELPIHVIVLTPITENRINGKELVPGDVIKMHNGKTVEVLNTDAEGRLIMADALTFAKKYNPCLVVDAATLTGSAFRITANHGAVIMGTDQKNLKALKKAGEKVYERLIELPMWEEFEDTLKSNIADINNLGSTEGQAVCAGFFLKNFIDYPWLHIDIAGPAFRGSKLHYLPKGGTGFGVRLLYQFFKDNFVN
tara:strand:- start:230 stop:1615 length:1386 start_codon:yes stop_codon:yes gene_type:complete